MIAATAVLDREQALRARCRGVSPLTARLEPWQIAFAHDADRLAELVEEYGSPVNLIAPQAMGPNATELRRVAATAGVDLRVFFARKANKALALVDEAQRLGLGVDVASERELRQVLNRGVAPASVIVTAAVKPRALLELCADRGVLVALDNDDERNLLADIATERGTTVPGALRLAPSPPEGRPPTRFGMTLSEAIAVGHQHRPAGPAPCLAIAGVHFHLDGYDATHRVDALHESFALIDALRAQGHHPSFIDIGGGIPMSYLDDSGEWSTFWREHTAGLLGDCPPLTFERHGLGYAVHGGTIVGQRNGYPYHQHPVRGGWLNDVLSAAGPGGGSIADALRARELQLRCEPGRSLLDGAGLTVARVEFRKQRADGTWLIGVAMNRTQCRSTSDDFMVDPLLIRPPAPRAGEPTPAMDGYLVGAYCIERELLTLRRLRFPDGVAIGDLVVFPNTAGYLMHILESASHQIPLARNVIVGTDGQTRLDDIDIVG